MRTTHQSIPRFVPGRLMSHVACDAVISLPVTYAPLLRVCDNIHLAHITGLVIYQNGYVIVVWIFKFE